MAPKPKRKKLECLVCHKTFDSDHRLKHNNKRHSVFTFATASSISDVTAPATEDHLAVIPLTDDHLAAIPPTDYHLAAISPAEDHLAVIPPSEDHLISFSENTVFLTTAIIQTHQTNRKTVGFPKRTFDNKSLEKRSFQSG